MLYDVSATENLSTEAQTSLIATVQSVARTDYLNDAGEVVRTVYARTEEADAALEELTWAFLPAIRRAARMARTLDADGDAFGVVLAAFVDAVRRYHVGSDLPFAATIATILARAISDADRTSGVVAVRENVAARYFRLLHAHGGDVAAAYEECKTSANGFEPLTFLAVHRAMQGIDSLDAPADGDEGPARRAEGIPLFGESGGSFVDEFADRDLCRWLFEHVSERQAAVLRAAYGFRDSATEAAVLAAGFRPGEPLSDLQVAGVLSGMTRPTVQRERQRGLDAMRAAYRGLIDAEETD